MAQAGALNGTLHYNSLAPYVGLGAETSPTGLSNLAFGVDVGALYLGAPTATVTAANPAVPASLLNGEQAALQNQASKYRFFPVVSVAVKYRF